MGVDDASAAVYLEMLPRHVRDEPPVADVVAVGIEGNPAGLEQSLQAAVAIRDKIVSAYLEISRMAI